ncbi:deaminase domain-containing protein [Bacillus proteolyticus]|uniref:deaminase domain-containing protein n=1 Tax=Bacillus proteolyticus TaxID=2026192 RepID=UPI003D0702AE
MNKLPKSMKNVGKKIKNIEIPNVFPEPSVAGVGNVGEGNTLGGELFSVAKSETKGQAQNANRLSGEKSATFFDELNLKNGSKVAEDAKDNLLKTNPVCKEFAKQIEVHSQKQAVEDVIKGTGKVYPTRQIDSVAEAHIIDRVKELRGNLSSKYKKAGNFALAEVEVNGLNKKEFYASSKIDEFKGNLEEKFPGISLKPNEPIFEASLALGKDGKPYMRDSDTEYKILNEITLKLGDDVNATGKIKLFTELDTCDSCSEVIAEFANKYKNVELEVIHNNGERLKP